MTLHPLEPTATSADGAILTIEHGLPGFPELSSLALSAIDDYGIFVWLFATEDDDVAFLAVNPFVYFPDYDIELSDFDEAALRAAPGDELIVYCLVAVNEQRTQATANLLAPIVINMTQAVARQIILETDHDLRAPLPVPDGLQAAPPVGDQR